MQEPNFKCPNCGLNWPPARCDELKPNGKYAPGDHIRCVECKNTFLRPIEQLETA